MTTLQTAPHESGSSRVPVLFFKYEEAIMGYGYSANAQHFTGKKKASKTAVRKKNPRSSRVHTNKYEKERNAGKDKVKSTS